MPLALRSQTPWFALFMVATLASIILFWRLDDRYLWQDEAATALLGQRLMAYGKPLAYDGQNLITMDLFRAEEFDVGKIPTASSDQAIRYFADRGDFKQDTTWVGHPWGQFILAGVSLKLLGKGTFQARLPFVLCGILAVILLWLFIRKHFDHPLMAVLAMAFCLGNVYWLLHMRQCRYYAPSCLMLLVTFIAYLRWQEGKRYGAAAFIAAAWCWFQVDYGSLWPVLLVLFCDAFRAAWPHIRSTFVAGLILALSLAPFVYYYDLVGRSAFTVGNSYALLFFGSVFYLNQFVVPLVILLVVAIFIWKRREEHSAEQVRIISLCLAIIVATLLWLPWVIPSVFHRYLVQLTPLAALLSASVVVQLGAELNRHLHLPEAVSGMTLAAVLIFTPAPAKLGSWLLPKGFWNHLDTGNWLRAEWPLWAKELRGQLPDPNGEVIRLLQEKLRPGDEILVNYEDIPFMFYTDATIRGGIPAFRVKDFDAKQARFFVFRRTAVFTNYKSFEEAMRRYRWRQISTQIADMPWSNVPDPWLRRYLLQDDLPKLTILEGIEEPKR